VYQVGINKGIILRCTAYQISRLIKEHIVAFAWQQWLRERVTVLGYTYIILLHFVYKL